MLILLPEMKILQSLFPFNLGTLGLFQWRALQIIQVVTIHLNSFFFVLFFSPMKKHLHGS